MGMETVGAMDILEKKYSRQRLIPVVILCLQISGCDEINGLWNPRKGIIESELPSDSHVFSLMAKGPNEKGYYDLSAIDHGQGILDTFSQNQQRDFSGQQPKHIGFHPGVIKEWPKNRAINIFAAEGDGAIKALDTEYKEISTREEAAPRYVSMFEWPSWGESVVVSPYRDGYLVLLKNYDPTTGKADERIVVSLSESANTLRGAEKVSVADLNGDGIDELIIVLSITGEIFEIAYPGNESSSKPKVRLLFKDLTFGTPNEAQIIDLDEDGDNDMVVPDEASPGKINILINDGTGQFSLGGAIDFPGNQGVYELRTAKDKDGLLYMLAAGRGYIVLYQKPSGWKPGDQMPNQVIQWPDNLTFDMILKDLDGDGWLDGVVGKYQGKNSIWVVYGPLWENFKSLYEKQFVLK